MVGLADEVLLAARLVADTESGEALPLLAFTLSQLAEGVGRGGELSAALCPAWRGPRCLGPAGRCRPGRGDRRRRSLASTASSAAGFPPAVLGLRRRYSVARDFPSSSLSRGPVSSYSLPRFKRSACLTRV
jgi:hypothetical protein